MLKRKRGAMREAELRVIAAARRLVEAWDGWRDVSDDLEKLGAAVHELNASAPMPAEQEGGRAR